MQLTGYNRTPAAQLHTPAHQQLQDITMNNAAPDPAYQIREKLAQLEQQLLEATPEMPNLLRDIHRTIKQDPDLGTVLTEQECSILVRGLKKQTATDIATKTAKKKSVAKSLKQTTIADL